MKAPRRTSRKPKIAVAYSGGLDTSVIVSWLRERYKANVITVTGNLGQQKALNGLAEKAYQSGAKKVFIQDLRKEFVEQYIWPTLQMGALYEHTYPMATAIGRPLLAKSLVEVARRERCTHVAHGCTGKGNDQVRFEVAIGVLAPKLKVIAPLREWEFTSREQEIEYCQQRGIPVSSTKASPYSIDENLWGTSIECGALEDLRNEPPEDAFQRTVAPKDAPDSPEYVSIRFDKGIPVALNRTPMEGIELIESLNTIAGAHGVGRLDLVENRLVGIKSREVYEAPAATVLHFAHRELERITLDKESFQMKMRMAQEYATLVYNGLWFTPLREAMDAFASSTQRTVNGTIKVKLYKGAIAVAERTSPNSLYDLRLATYTEDDTFDHVSSKGFISIYGLPAKTFYAINKSLLKKPRLVKKLTKKKK